ncbi:outer membrane beta-barrel protein [Aquiflexum lacus]|uniref:outer membrane beta-barrel protein n=1 Tax=Aquiflexum lacus TaxID=2483805 RepID=UPI001892E5D4|nr:outer membrane beta-barrel protein [Aquiflexum lacus]
MKKIILIPVLILVSLFEVSAQSIEITPFTGYTFDHGFPIFGGRARLGGGQTVGGMLGFGLNDLAEVELLYSYQAGIGTANSSQLNGPVRERIQAHYAMIGYNRLFPTSSQMAFFSGLKVGTGTLASTDNTFNNITRFTVGINGGMKYFFTDNVGLRLQANLMMPISNVGANLWWSPGGGTQVGVGGFSSVIQFGFTGAVVIRLPR